MDEKRCAENSGFHYLVINSKTIQINKGDKRDYASSVRDGLEKVIGGIIFDGRKTQSIIDSYHSKRGSNWPWR